MARLSPRPPPADANPAQTNGKGGSPYPNALGNLAIARSVLRALGGLKDPTPLVFSGYSEWGGDSVVAHVRVRNMSGGRRIGRMEVYPLPGDRVASPSPIPYNFSHTESVEFDVAWPRIKRTRISAEFPANRYVAPGIPQVAVVDFCKGQSRVYLATCPIWPFAALVRRADRGPGGRGDGPNRVPAGRSGGGR